MVLIEYYLNNKPTGIIEPETTENLARAIKWVQAYSELLGTDINLGTGPVKRKVKVD